MATKEEVEQLWKDEKNWWKGMVYRCPQDPRVVVPKSRRWMGWTLNFAHGHAWTVLFSSFVIALAPTFLLFCRGEIEYWPYLVGVSIAIAILIAMSIYLENKY